MSAAKPSSVSRRAIWVAFAATLCVWLVIAWLDLKLRNPTSPGGIVSLELAFTSTRFSDIVARWGPDALRAAWWSLGVDFAFLLLYARWLSLWVRSVSLQMTEHSPLVSRWGRKFERMVWIAALLDSAENVGLAYALRLHGEVSIAGSAGAAGTLATPVLVAGVCATIKFVLLIAALFYALNGGFAVWMAQAGGPPPKA